LNIFIVLKRLGNFGFFYFVSPCAVRMHMERNFGFGVWIQSPDLPPSSRAHTRFTPRDHTTRAR